VDWLREKVATKVDLSDLPPKFGEPEGSLFYETEELIMHGSHYHPGVDDSVALMGQVVLSTCFGSLSSYLRPYRLPCL
jgi:hypothetical protein